MPDTAIHPEPAKVRRIELNELAADVVGVIEKLRRTGETLEVVEGGATIACIAPAKADATSHRKSVIGMSRGVMRLAKEGDLLDDLLTPEEIEEFYKGDVFPDNSR